MASNNKLTFDQFVFEFKQEIPFGNTTHLLIVTRREEDRRVTETGTETQGACADSGGEVWNGPLAARPRANQVSTGVF